MTVMVSSTEQPQLSLQGACTLCTVSFTLYHNLRRWEFYPLGTDEETDSQRLQGSGRVRKLCKGWQICKAP